LVVVGASVGYMQVSWSGLAHVASHNALRP